VTIGEDVGLRHGQASAGDEIHFDARIAGATDATPRNGVALNPDAKKKENGQAKVHEGGITEEGFEVEFIGVGRVMVHGWSVGGSAIVNWLGDDGDVGYAGLAKGIDDGGKSAKGNCFIAAEEDGVLRALELLFNFVGELMDVDRIVAEIDALIFVDSDDEALLCDFLDSVGFGDVDFDAGLEDGGGDHEDNQENENNVDERHHVDVGERGLCGFD